METKHGIGLRCVPVDRARLGLMVRCLKCGRGFPLQLAAITAWAWGEEIGFIGTCCLRADGRARFEAKCREFEAAGTGAEH